MAFIYCRSRMSQSCVAHVKDMSLSIIFNVLKVFSHISERLPVDFMNINGISVFTALIPSANGKDLLSPIV